MLSVVMLHVITPSNIMPSVVILRVVTLIAAGKDFFSLSPNFKTLTPELIILPFKTFKNFFRRHNIQ